MEDNLHKYQRIQNILLAEIKSGKYKAGDLIPSDNVLMKQFSVSKSTITQALKSLSQEGYIQRIQGKGSYVSGQSESAPLRFYLCPIERNEEAYWVDLVNRFNALNNGFSVEITFIYNDLVPLRDTLFRAFASGNAPDIFTLDGPDVSYWAYMKSLQPLDSFVSQEYLNRFIPTILRQGTYKNHLYHLGYYESSLCIIYDRELFSRLHIRIPNDVADAWSWDEFLEICSVIRSKTDIQYPLLMDTGRGLTSKQGEWISYSTLPFIIQNKGEIFDEKLSHTNGYLNSPSTVEAITWLGDLFHRYRYTHMEDLHHLFPDHFAMSLSLPSAFFALAPEKQKRVGVIPLPKHLCSAVSHGSWGLCMSAQTKHPKECWMFMQFVLSLENQLQYAKYSGVPILKEIFNILQGFNATSNCIDVIFSQLHDAVYTRPITPAYPFFSKTFSSAFLEVAAGADAKECLDAASKQIDEHILRHNFFRD